MTKNIPLSRPAMSAIAAFLALSAPAAFAQEAPTVPMTSPVGTPPPVAAPTPAPTPGPTAPAPAQQTAPVPAPKPVIRVPLDLPPVPAEPAPKAEAPATSTTPERAERPAPRQRSAERAPIAAPKAAAPAPAGASADAVSGTEAGPITAPMTTLPEPVAETAPAPVETAAPAGSGFLWELAGGAAALLIVGGAGLAFARRRRNAEETADEGMSYEEMAAAEAVPYSPPAAEPEPIALAAPVEPRSTPAFAVAPHGSMGRHEAMALAGPTPDNPFATLAKRLKRARFLDQQERQAYEDTLAGQKDLRRKPATAWEISHRVEPASAEQEVRRPEAGRGRANTLRPGWNRP